MLFEDAASTSVILETVYFAGPQAVSVSTTARAKPTMFDDVRFTGRSAAMGLVPRAVLSMKTLLANT